MKLSKKILATVAATVLAPSLFAATSNDAGRQLVTKLANGQVSIVQQFNSIGNLEGFVVETVHGPKQKSIVYADKQGQYMVVGTVIDANGNNISQRDYTAQVTDVQAPKVYVDATKTNWVQDGNPKAPHKAYIMIEPNCIACHMLYQALKPMLASGQLSVRWILVSFMKPQSDGMVAAIMQAKDVSAAMSFDENNFDTKTETGGIKPVAVTPAIKERIKQNMDFMTNAGFAGTPVIIFKTTDGKYQIIPGFLQGKNLQDAVNSMSDQF